MSNAGHHPQAGRRAACSVASGVTPETVGCMALIRGLSIVNRILFQGGHPSAGQAPPNGFDYLPSRRQHTQSGQGAPVDYWLPVNKYL